MGVGVLIAILPHLIERLRSGTWSYITDPDERLCYLPAISHSYTVHPWKLGDPALPTGGISIYPWLQFVPFILFAKAIHAGPMGVLFLMRIWAGASLGLVAFLLGRALLGRALPALWIALVFLMDNGLTNGRPVERTLVKVIEVLRPPSNQLSEEWVPYLGQYRLLTPGNSWFFMGLFLLLLLRARHHWTRWNTALTAGAFGLLFSIYFYYWTGAGLALILLILLDWQRWRNYVAIGVGGVLVGLPALLANAGAKHSQGEGWLQRLDLFLPIGRFDGLNVHKGVWIYCILASGFVWRRHRDLLPFWCLAIAGLLLMDHQVLTKLQIQNDHFIFTWSIPAFLLVVTLVTRELRSRFAGQRWLPRLGVVLLVLFAMSVALFRVKEFSNNKEIVNTRANLRAFRGAEAGHPPLVANSVIAGDVDFTDFAVILEGQRALAGGLALSHSVSDSDWKQRRVLDLLVSGESIDDAAHRADSYYGCFWSQRRQTQSEMSTEFTSRQMIGRDLLSHIDESLRHYDVRYVAVKRGMKSPVSTLSTWHALPGGQQWQVWERTRPLH